MALSLRHILWTSLDTTAIVCFPAQAEDSVVAFGPLTANHFGARFAHIAWAGAGIFPTTSGNGRGTPSIPQLYNRTLPRDPTPAWNAANFVPQACSSHLSYTARCTTHHANDVRQIEQSSVILESSD